MGCALKTRPNLFLFIKRRLVQKLGSNLTVNDIAHTKLTGYILNSPKLSGYMLNRNGHHHPATGKNPLFASLSDGRNRWFSAKNQHENRREGGYFRQRQN